MPYHKPLHCGAGLVLAAMLGLAAPQPLLSGQDITPAELPPGLRSFPLPLKVVARVSFVDRNDPTRARQFRSTSYYFPEDTVVHYSHRDGEMVIYGGINRKVRYWGKRCDPFIQEYFGDTVFPREVPGLMPYGRIYGFILWLNDQPGGVRRRSLGELKRMILEHGTSVSKSRVDVRRRRDFDFFWECEVDERGRPVSYAHGHWFYAAKFPSGAVQEPARFRYCREWYSDYVELPDGSWLPRMIKHWFRYGMEIETTIQVEELTLLPKETTSRDVLRQLTQHLPERQCYTPPRLTLSELVRSPTDKARAVFAAAVALLAAVWFVFRLRGRRI